MAIQQPTTTRRGALAALAVLPAIATVPSIAFANGVDRSAWNAAIAAYEKADADSDLALERWSKAAETYEAITGGRTAWDKGPLDEAAARLSGFAQLNHNIDDWGDRLSEAADRVLEMPAPDLQALLWKLEYLFGQELDKGGTSTACWSAEFFAQTMADARRLLSAGRAIQ